MPIRDGRAAWFCLAVAASGTLAAAVRADPGSCSNVPVFRRVNCFPRGLVSSQACEARGCCFDPTRAQSSVACYYPPEFGYAFTGGLDRTGGGETLRGTLSQPNPAVSPYGGHLGKLSVEVASPAAGMIRMRVTDPNATRFEASSLFGPLPRAPSPGLSAPINWTTTSAPFGVAAWRAADGPSRPFFDTRSVGGLIFSDQFIQLSVALAPGSTLYGLGERVWTQFDLGIPSNGTGDNSTRIPFWNTDSQTPFGTENNLYGSHPFVVGLDPSGNAFGLLFLSSTGLEATAQPGPIVTFRAIGGTIDIWLFSGPTPDLVVQQYTAAVGRPRMVPYWSLGFHLCQWGYDSAERTRAVNANLTKYGVPLDVQWNDIDYMEQHLDFTVGKDNYSALPELVDDIHSKGQRYVLIVDPGISNTQPQGAYAPYDEGTQLGVWLNLSGPEGTPTGAFVGSVWPGPCVFPDFFGEGAREWWGRQVAAFHKQIPFDGLWIDMNEAAISPYNYTAQCGRDRFTNPPFDPMVNPIARADAKPGADNMAFMNVCPNAASARGRVYDVHNAYGTAEANATMPVLEDITGERSIVVSRSTFVGHGAVGSHWLGDNDSNFKHMASSIPGILSFNTFGVPLVGPDICGLHSATDYELCLRWFMLGAFYPFSRSHNNKGLPPQDPTAFGRAFAARVAGAYNLRYSLLPYLYTLFWRATSTGTPVARALAFEFPADTHARTQSRQFMWGSGLLISPPLVPGDGAIQAYLPPASTWYDFYTGATVEPAAQTSMPPPPSEQQLCSVRPGMTVASGTTTPAHPRPFQASEAECCLACSLDEQCTVWTRDATQSNCTLWRLDTTRVPSGDNNTVLGFAQVPRRAPYNAEFSFDSAQGPPIPLHVRGGSVLPMQSPALTTSAARKNPYSLLVAPENPEQGGATGVLYVDDGVSLVSDIGDKYLLVEFTQGRRSLSANVTHAPPPGFAAEIPALDGLRVFGVSVGVTELLIKSAGGKPRVVDPSQYSYNGTVGVLSVTGLGQNLTQGFTVEWTI